MKKAKTMKRTLFSLFMSMLLCISMLIGTTFAWFTDSVSSGVNTIVAGNLDVEVYHSSASVSTNKTIENETKLFRDVNGNAMLWEPGAVSYETFTVKNEGSLALKYKLAMNILDYNAVSGTTYTLKDVLKVKVLTGSDILSTVTRNTVQALDWNVSDTLNVFNTAGNLEAGESDVFQVIVYWVPGANDNNFNVNNGKATTDGQPLFINFGINVVASQLNHENDSFGPDYDQGIALPDLPVSINKVFRSAPITGESVTESIEVKNVSTDAGVATVQADSVNAVISALKGQATDIATDSDLSTVIYLDVQTADKAETSVTYEIDMYAKLTYTDTTGTSQTTTLESLNGNLANKIVTATMDIGRGLSNVTVKHHDTPMTKLATVYTEEEGYYYNKTTGVLTIKSKSFSPFTVNYTIEGVAAVGDKVYSTLDEAVAAAQSGDTVVLLKDVTLTSDLQLGGNGKSLTLHLNKHTVDGGEYQVYTAGVGTINICGGGTIKNNNTGKNADYAPLRIYQYSSVVLDDVTVNGIYCAVKNSGNLTVKKANITGTTFGLGCFLDGTTVIGQLDGDNSDVVVTAQEQALGTAVATGYAAMNVTVYSGTFTSSGIDWDDCPVYWAGHGTLNVYGGTFKNETSGTGAAGLLQKNGTVNVYGGTFNAKDGIKLVAQSDSTELVNKIEGGAFVGTRSGIYIDASDSKYMGQLSQYGVSIANGNSVPTFMGGTEGAIYAKTGGLGDRTLMTVTGGNFSSDPNEFCADGYGAVRVGYYYQVIAGNFVTTEDELKTALSGSDTTVRLGKSITLSGPLTISRDVTLCGSGNYTISGFPVYVGTTSNVTFKDVNFATPTNANNKASCVYASGFTAKVMFDGCTFTNPQWECIQITPMDGAEIIVTNCTFVVDGSGSYAHGTKVERLLHIQNTADSGRYTAVITNNKFIGVDLCRNAVIDVDDIASFANVTCGRNTFFNHDNTDVPTLADGMIYVNIKGRYDAANVATNTYAQFTQDADAALHH